MRIESSVTSVSWIPVEALRGYLRLPLDLGIGHYDIPPPDKLTGPHELEALRRADRFRFANELRAYVEVEDNRIVDYGQSGRGHIGATALRFGPASICIPAVAMPDLRPDPEVGEGWVRFVQTSGGHTGAPLPRRVAHPPFVQITAPIAWTTLALTIHADGHTDFELHGASPFPRHWIYDHDGKLAAKSGVIDFRTWSAEYFGDNNPWGQRDALAVVAAVESTVERALSTIIMRGHRRVLRTLTPGQTLVEQGERSAEVFLLLDGLLSVEVDGKPIAEVGPGAILGEGAFLSGGQRTATLRAVTACRVVVAAGRDLDKDALAKLHATRQALRNGGMQPDGS
jgi:hypothetical protein